MRTLQTPLPAVADKLRGRATRVGLVGTGVIAEIHLAVLRRLPEIDVIGVCDVDREKARRFASKHGLPAAYGGADEMRGEGMPDAAHVLVPPPAHGAVAAPLLRAGIHVLVEKPMALTVSEGRELLAAAEEGGARLGVNHNYTFHPGFARLRGDLEKGRIGRAQHVVAVHNNPLRQLAAGEFGHWMFERPQNVLYEQGPHALSQILALLGPLLDAQVVPGGRRDLPGGRVFFETWQGALRCERGTAQLFLAFGREHAEQTVTVLGQDGSLRTDLLHGAYSVREKTRWPDFAESALLLVRDASRAEWASVKAAADYLLPLFKLSERRDPFYAGMKGSLGGFHRALRDGTRIPVSGEDGLAVLEALEKVTAPAIEMARSRPAAPLAAIEELREARPRETAVIGATGFIGGHVVEQLARAGRNVRILARNPAVLPAHLRHPSVRFVKGSLADAAALDRVVAGADAVIHLASGGGDRYEDFERTIVEGTRAVAEACLKHRVRRLLYASTVAAYDFGAGSSVTEASPLDRRPEERSHYSRAKIASERLLEELHRSRQLPVVTLRPAVVVGERGRPMHTGVGQWPRDSQCVGWGGGTTPIPFVLAEDVASAFVAALDVPEIDGQSFNLAGDVRLTAREYVDELARATGRPIRFHAVPLVVTQASDLFKWLVKLAIRKPENAFPSYRDLRSRSFRATLDCARAKEALGWKPAADRARFVERGIRAAVGG